MQAKNLVKCLDTFNSNIQEGSFYTVERVKGDYIALVEDDQDFLYNKKSFEVVPDLLSHPKMNEGTKHDSGKPRISLIPRDALWGCANALTYGEIKYGTNNFKNGIDYSRLADACYRHLSAFMEGENIDEESGNCHLDHAMASLAMLKYMSVHKKEKDDRHKKD